MGYAIAAPMKSAKAQKKMYEFMQTNFKTALELFPKHVEENYDSSNGGPRYGEDVAYDGKKLGLAFHYSGGGVDRFYVWTICQWMALKGGRKNGAGKAYVRYDGYESLEVPADSVLGVSADPLEIAHLGDTKQVIKTLVVEMQRLDNLWEQENDN